ncbi:hypothetical protein PspTeo4_01600 [Pseudomonas sp. Teo4]|nr:hypothetical protein [Pseudomonas sp. Teo4]
MERSHSRPAQPLTWRADFSHANHRPQARQPGVQPQPEYRARLGVAGALVAGPVGLLAGLWLGGKEEEATFLATFKDGRKLMAITDGKTWSKIDDSWRRHRHPASND